MQVSKLLLLSVLSICLLRAAKTLEVMTIDVEGGKAMLVISPSGESMLVDVGWAGSANREASTDLLVASAKAAGLKQIDYLVITHYDGDHMGDVPGLVAKFPVRRLVDHGPATTDGKNIQVRYKAYADLFPRIERIIVRPGDRIPIKGLDVRVLTSAGQSIAMPLPGAGQATASCSTTSQLPSISEDAEDDASIGLLFTFGKFRMIDLADLEAHASYDLACPLNRIGTVDVYNVNVHGQFKGMTPVLLDALRPRVAIMANGARKGGDPPTWPILRSSPGLEDIWQSHFSVSGGKDRNASDDFLANIEPECQKKAIRVSARQDGSFTVTNTRNGFHKTYPARRTTASGQTLPR